MTDDERREWLEWRRKGIGGSDVAGILGLSKWSTPFSVWMDKTHGSEQEETPAMKRGRMLEPAVLEWAAEDLGLNWEPGYQMVHPAHDWARMTSDAWTYSDGDSTFDYDGLEAKTVDRFDEDEWGEPGTDQVPLAYRIQCQWYMVVSGAKLWRLAALSMRQDELRIYEITIEPDVAERLLEVVGSWWERHVIGGERPNLDTTAAARAYLRQKYANPLEQHIETGDADIAQKLLWYDTAKYFRDGWQAQMDAAAMEIKTLIGGYKGIETPEHRATWSRFERTEVDLKALRKAHPEIVEQFTTYPQADRLLVTRKKT